MGYWILKTEPSAYSFDDLLKEGRAVWDGVTNPLALKHIRAMHKGDQALIYHTGGEKAVVGIAQVSTEPFPDPKNPKLTVIEIRPVRRLPKPVPLAGIRAVAALKDLALVHMPRLSVVPATAAQWRVLLDLAGA